LVQRKGKVRFFGERKQKEKSACFHNGKKLLQEKGIKEMKWGRS